ncbi:hypothetical protein [Tolypothrix sp. VBCCA 56010]
MNKESIYIHQRDRLLQLALPNCSLIENGSGIFLVKNPRQCTGDRG